MRHFGANDKQKQRYTHLTQDPGEPHSSKRTEWEKFNAMELGRNRNDCKMVSIKNKMCTPVEKVCENFENTFDLELNSCKKRQFELHLSISSIYSMIILLKGGLWYSLPKFSTLVRLVFYFQCQKTLLTVSITVNLFQQTL